MPRILLFVIAVLAFAASALPAEAKVVSHRTGQDPEAVRAYWTEERMRSARPVARVKPESQGKGKPGGGGGGDTSWSTLQVSWPASGDPLYAHGKVFFTDNGSRYQCSGTAVSSASGSVVWTAGHCVHDGPGDFVTDWLFVPAYNADGITAPYGEWPADSLHTTAAWAQKGEFGRDLGAARVFPRNGQTLDAVVPGPSRGLNFEPDYTISTRLNAYGYPAAGKYDGRNMYVCDTYISRYDSSTDPDALGIPCGMTGGSSGGGWVDTGGKLVSVVSYGYQSLKNVLFGPRHDTQAGSLLSAAESSTGSDSTS